MRMNYRTAATLCLLTFTGLSGGPSSATLCAPRFPQITQTTTSISSINLRGTNAGAPVCDSCITTAAQAWNNSCSSSGNPGLLTNSSASINVNVDFIGGDNPGFFSNCSASKCACTNVSFQDGKVIGASVKIFERANGASCTSAWTSILTHEFGHVLGLDDADPALCGGRIMGDNFGLIMQEDCDEVDKNFETDVERARGEFDHPCQFIVK